MKNVFLLIAMVIGLTGQAQELKGFKLGKKYTKLTHNITLGGIPAVVDLNVLNDKRCCQITVIFWENGRKRYLTNNETYNIILGLENKYDCILQKRYKNTYSNDYNLSKRIGNMSIVMSVKHNKYRAIPNDVFLGIMDNNLLKIKRQEERSRAMCDF